MGLMDLSAPQCKTSVTTYYRFAASQLRGLTSRSFSWYSHCACYTKAAPLSRGRILPLYKMRVKKKQTKQFLAYRLFQHSANPGSNDKRAIRKKMYNFY